MYAAASSESDGSETPYPNSPKKHKGKGWGKVSWFSRRSSKSRSSRPSSESSCSAANNSPTHQKNEVEARLKLTRCSHAKLIHNTGADRMASVSSYSSDEESVVASEHGYKVKRSRRYPNSEIIEQNCLRPSVTKMVFSQMLTSNQRKGKHSKHHRTWTKKSSKTRPKADELFEETLSRALSMPSEMGHGDCHCIACCVCSAADRLSGRCPAYIRRCTSTTSLDTGLNDLNDLQALCSDNTTKQVDDDSVFVTPQESNKSASLPSSYRQSFQRKCRFCGLIIRQQHGQPIQVKYNSNTPPSPIFCECASLVANNRRDCNKEQQPCDTTQPKQAPVSPADFNSKLKTVISWFKDFNHEQRNLLLKELLETSESPQQHVLSELMESQLHVNCPPNCRDRISWLPDTVALHIFSFLDPVSLGRASGVCRNWYILSTEGSLWRRLSYISKWQMSEAGEQKQLISHMTPHGTIQWKRVFAERYRLRNNWLKGRCTVRTFEGHTQGISCVQFDDTRIVSGSSDKTIKVWNIRTNSPWSVQTLVGHSGTVRCLHLEGNRLVSGSTDKSIKVWDLSTQQSWSSIACKVTMVGHLDTVRCLQVDDEKVVSGSYDKTLKIWNIRTGHCRMTLRGHDAAVLCVQFDKDKIVSGSCDKTIKVWTFEGACVMTLQGHHDAVTCLQFDSTRIVSGSLDCNLKFWDIHSGQCINTIDWKASEGHTGVVRCLQADSWRVVSASDDRTLKVWNLETGQRLVTLRNHSDGVTCLQFNDSIIVSGSYDKTVKLWDFSCV